VFLAALSDLRKRWLLVATLAAAGAAVAAGFGFTAAKRYQATATFVVQPVAPSDPALLGIDVLHDTSRRTAAATAAHLIEAPEVAEAVRVRLGLRGTRASILHAVHAHPDAHSDAVEVVVTDGDPARAAQLANAFVDAFITRRTAGFQSEIASAVRRVRAQLVALPPNRRLSPEGVELQKRLGDLRALVGTADPTIRHGSEAVAPASASWPHPWRWTILGALIGLGAGALLALGLGAAHRRKELPEYDPRVSERVVEQLEQRLNERIAALAEEQRRLAAREASLAVRERDVTAKLEELRATVSAAPAPGQADPEAERRLAEREGALEARVASVTDRERAVVRRAVELDHRERDLAQVPAAADDSAVREREEELAGRLLELEERVKALDERERGLERQAEELGGLESTLREAEANLARRAQDLTAREAELAVSPPPAPEPAPEAPSAPAPAAPPVQIPPGEPGWRLDELERLVVAHGGENPDRAEEWQSYLFYLRDYVDVDGRVPRQFDWLIEDTFGDLLAASR
jgi:capsular polysaccharide biosynthesis protein